MIKNMSIADRTIRFLAAAVIIALYFLNMLSGTVAIVLLVVAGAFILTSFISFCPVYYPFHFSTKKKSR